jgi:hypothetical protein
VEKHRETTLIEIANILGKPCPFHPSQFTLDLLEPRSGWAMRGRRQIKSANNLWSTYAKGQPQQQSGDKRKEQKLQGKALQVNENSVEDQEPARSPAPPLRGSGDKRNHQKFQGKALQVNENSVEDQEPAQSPAPPRRG